MYRLSMRIFDFDASYYDSSCSCFVIANFFIACLMQNVHEHRCKTRKLCGAQGVHKASRGGGVIAH